MLAAATDMQVSEGLMAAGKDHGVIAWVRLTMTLSRSASVLPVGITGIKELLLIICSSILLPAQCAFSCNRCHLALSNYYLLLLNIGSLQRMAAFVTQAPCCCCWQLPVQLHPLLAAVFACLLLLDCFLPGAPHRRHC